MFQSEAVLTSDAFMKDRRNRSLVYTIFVGALHENLCKIKLRMMRNHLAPLLINRSFAIKMDAHDCIQVLFNSMTGC